MDSELGGEWKNFVFKFVQPEDHTRILKHLRECLYYPAFYRLGYTKEMDDEMESIFKDILKEETNMNFYAEDKTTGKVAGCRIITMEKTDKNPGNPFKSQTCRGIYRLYMGLVDDCKVPEKYNLIEFPHMFGVSVDPEFSRQGLSTEIYLRAKNMLISRGFTLSMVGFISPYSRAAANHHGFIQMASKFLLEAVDDEGNTLYPEADPNNFLDVGIFLH